MRRLIERQVRNAGALADALAFLTVLPLPETSRTGDLARAVRYFPLVGAWIGCLPAAVLVYASAVLPVPVAAGLAVAAGVLFTGALHEDGLADTADGFGARDRERALEIMRDSRTGSYGVLALIFSAGIRWAALAGMAPMQGALALIVAHGVSRGLLAPVPLLAAYARPQGLGRALDAIRAADVAIALLYTIGIALVPIGVGLAEPLGVLHAGDWAGLSALAIAAIAAGAVLALTVRRLGGYTGDTLGAIQQAAEIAALLAFAALWS